jgi:RNA-directed DNA polymerase
VSNHPNNDKLWEQVNRRLREELTKLKVQIREEKTKYLNPGKGETFSFLGFEYRKNKTRTGIWGGVVSTQETGQTKAKGQTKGGLHI